MACKYPDNHTVCKPRTFCISVCTCSLVRLLSCKFRVALAYLRPVEEVLLVLWYSLNKYVSWLLMFNYWPIHTLACMIPTKVWVPGAAANPKSFAPGNSPWSWSMIYYKSVDHSTGTQRQLMAMHLNASVILWTAHVLVLFKVNN
jgi:hypothetical protein